MVEYNTKQSIRRQTNLMSILQLHDRFSHCIYQSNEIGDEHNLIIYFNKTIIAFYVLNQNNLVCKQSKYNPNVKSYGYLAKLNHWV
jgi:hypothetical protein